MSGQLSDYCELISGRHIPVKQYNKESKGMGYLTGPSDFGTLYPVVSKWSEHPQSTALPGDILITVKGSGVGKINLLNGEEVAISRQLMAIRPKDINSQFLYLFIGSKFEHFQSKANGAAIPGISRDDVLELGLPPFSLAEQKRIVSILDEAFSAIAKAKENAEKNLLAARELFESYLNRVFTQQGPGWQEKPLTELCVTDRVITYGVIKLGDRIPNGVPCLRTSNVKKLRIETAGMKRIAKQLSDDYSRTILQGGEVLVNVRGTLGGVAVVPSEMVGWNVSREVAVAPIDDTQIMPEYVAFCVASKGQQDWLTGVKKGAAYTGINIGDLRRLPIRFPKTKSGQKQVVDVVNKATLAARRLETIYTQKLTNLDELKQSLLQKAFTGQLTREKVSA